MLKINKNYKKPIFGEFGIGEFGTAITIEHVELIDDNKIKITYNNGEYFIEDIDIAFKPVDIATNLPLDNQLYYFTDWNKINDTFI